MQLFLKVGQGDHQVGSMLANIAHLKSGRIGELVLDREIPLLRNCGSYVRIPQADDRVLKWIGGGRQQPFTGSRSRQITVGIVRLKFSTGWRVHRKPEIVARTLQVRGDS